MTATYSVAAKVAANQSFADLIDSGVSAGYISVRAADTTLLATIPLNDPCGTVDGGTGVLTFNVTGASDSSADATGTASYAEFCDSDGDVHLTLTASAGTTPVSGEFVMNTLSVVAGGPVQLVSATIG